MSGAYPIVYTMPVSEVCHALMVASVGPRGKPQKVVASQVQVDAWKHEFWALDLSMSRATGPWARGEALNIMGIPVEVGPDAQPQLVWTQEIKAREKVSA